MHRYFIINKPRNMVSQFVSSHEVGLLGQLDVDFPAGTHAVGRLDKDSEGLLILTTNKSITRKLFLARPAHLRTYLVMVQNEMSNQTLETLRNGISIKIKTGELYKAKPISIERVTNPIEVYPHAHDPRMAYPHTWLCITLAEGKYRQVRKMVLAARHRCLRLVRLSISQLELGTLAPGQVLEMDETAFLQKLFPASTHPS